MSLTGVAVLLILEPDSAADAEQRGIRQRVVAAGGRCSVNGKPPLPAYELSHIVSSSWDSIRRHAPSLARRHTDAEHSPLKRQRLCWPSHSDHEGRSCHLVTPQWLQATLIAGELQPESEFRIQPTSLTVAAATTMNSAACESGSVSKQEPGSVHREKMEDGSAAASVDQEQGEAEDLTAALIAHLDGLANLVESHDPATGVFRKRALILAINCIKQYRKLGHVLTSRSNFIELCEQPNSPLAAVGKKTREKCSEFLCTRTTRRAAGYENDPRISVEELFKRIWGVGKYTAKKLYEPPHNLRTIADLRAAVDAAELSGRPALLDNRQLIGLRYFEDLDR